MSSSTSSSRRGLAAFGLAGALGLACLFAASEWLVRAHVLPQDEFAAHRNFFRAVQPGNVAFGDSHVARGFAPDASFINLAYPSEAIPHISWKARRYFARHFSSSTSVRTKVILQADPHLFSPYRLISRLADYPQSFDRPPDGPLILQSRYRDRLTGYWSAFLRNGAALISRVDRTARGALLSPGDLSRVPARRRLYDARARVRIHSPVDLPQLDEAKTEYAALVDFLIRRGAELCLVSFPLSRDYRAALVRTPRATQELRADLMAFFRAQAGRVGARHVDHQSRVAGRAAFRDVDHLNGGAAPGYAADLQAACFSPSASTEPVKTSRR